MRITINESKSIGSIQEEFSRLFPYLKLEFFFGHHELGGGHRANMVYNDATPIGEVGCVEGEQSFEITPKMTVEALEHALSQKFKVAAEVYRLSEGYWMDTSETDWWTLEEQNNRGEEAAYHYHADIATVGTIY
jgi:hypothetical protein